MLCLFKQKRAYELRISDWGSDGCSADLFANLFETRTGGPAVLDLCWHLPSGLIDRRYAPKIAEAVPGRIATLTVHIAEHRAPPSRRQPYRIVCHDDSGFMELVFFHAHRDYLMKMLPPGEVRAVSGKLEVFTDRLQMTHPDQNAPPTAAAKTGRAQLRERECQ